MLKPPLEAVSYHNVSRLDPHNLGVRMPHASALMAIVRQMPAAPPRDELMEKARRDFQ
jgi:hypothetical protein